MKQSIIYVLSTLLLLTSCGNYNQVLKSTDNELKYTTAKEYFESKHYMKAYTLLENISTYYKGTERSEEILYLIAQSHFGNEDFLIANNYFKTYTKTFPRGKHIEDSWFYAGRCYYELSPDARLDQTDTNQAIEELNEYLSYYPNGKYAEDARNLISELRKKLALKAYQNTKLYYNLGNYMGNNYLSAVVTAENAIRDYPESEYNEELAYIILCSKYEQAKQSVEDKKDKRYVEASDEYHNFISEYPDSKFAKDASKMYQNIQKYIQK